MLGIYFSVILTLFIVMIVGAVIGYSQPLSEIEKPLKDSISKYDKDSSDKKIVTVTKAWDKVQEDVSCLFKEEEIPFHDKNMNRAFLAFFFKWWQSARGHNICICKLYAPGRHLVL